MNFAHGMVKKKKDVNVGRLVGQSETVVQTEINQQLSGGLL